MHDCDAVIPSLYSSKSQFLQTITVQRWGDLCVALAHENVNEWDQGDIFIPVAIHALHIYGLSDHYAFLPCHLTLTHGLVADKHVMKARK